ncbi:N-acetylmuramoyl-L-alanine amidase family protein [Lysinibacillus contaminans]|uniref:N-acetylmuramoyl-L-alanine amidase family protein n=1 Tax=Lysinibacillus contaminans TaxID=1293441 RepID=UPI0006AEA93C|nr:N-acetylmuramoyl-L-alanine amidase [Lysinibacillus contaminans]
MLILFDYGHGGKDPGATFKGRHEADDVLVLGQAVAKRLRAARVVIDETRTSNVGVSLEQRVKMEWKKTYDFFISFHRNAFKPEVGTGAEVYVYKTANSKSKPLAAKIQRALVRVGFRDRGVKEADFYVLKHTRAPALLLEIGFIDNSADNKLFDLQFEAIVDGIANAIIEVTGVEKVSKCSTCGQVIV